MNKPYLLIAGDDYYPSRGTRDWKERFDSYEEANAAITESPVYIKITKGKRKGESELSYTSYEYKENKFDWYEIVNLETEYPNSIIDNQKTEQQWFELKIMIGELCFNLNIFIVFWVGYFNKWSGWETVGQILIFSLIWFMTNDFCEKVEKDTV